MSDQSNHPYADVEVGASASATHTLSRMDVEILALAAGDIDPAKNEPSGTQVLATESAALATFVFRLLGNTLPGPGTTILAQDFRYRGEITTGDTIMATITAREKHDAERSIVFDACCSNQHDEELLAGTVTVQAPGERVEHGEFVTPELILRRGDGFGKLLARCAGLAAVRCAIVHPCDAAALHGAMAAAEHGFIEPVLVGPEAKIRAVADTEGIDLAGITIESTPHSHAAAARAVAMAREGDVDALMKGSLHTDELMAEVLSATSGLRTERRVSHVFVMDVPAYPRMLLITDAAINIEPALEVKADIVRNVIDLAHALGIDQPKIAILSAVETVNPKIASTLDAAALCKMADRGQIVGGILDGPLAFDNAISPEATREKGIVSPVAGRADVLVVPDLEAGNMLAKQLQYLAGAQSAGIALGARVPIALTSRADSVQSRVVSAALVVLLADAAKRRLGKASPIATEGALAAALGGSPRNAPQ